MKKLIYILNYFLLGILIIAAPTLSWLFYEISLNPRVDGQTVESYFHRGDGSYEFPFTITKPVHLYNLSKLQELGAFGNTSYYFQLGIEVDDDGNIIDNVQYTLVDGIPTPPTGVTYNYRVYSETDLAVGGNPSAKSLDMSALLKDGNNFIRPIGGSLITKDTRGQDLAEVNYYPSEFLGFFEGHSLAIKNLYVVANDSFCHVGMFGAIGDGALVENFILDSPKVEAASSNPIKLSYTDLSKDDTTNFHNYVGFIAGYTNGGLFNIGVYKGDFKLSSTLYQSKFSWVGFGTRFVSNSANAAGKILDYILDFARLSTALGTSGTTDQKNQNTRIEFSKQSAYAPIFANEATRPYDPAVFEIVSPWSIEAPNSSVMTYSGSYYFPQYQFNSQNQPTDLEFAKAPPDYETIISTTHAGMVTIYQPYGSNATLQTGFGGIRFKVDGAGSLLFTYAMESTSAGLSVYKHNGSTNPDGTPLINSSTNTFTPYTNAHWLFSSGLQNNLTNIISATGATVNNVRTNYFPTRDYNTTRSCVLTVHEPGLYIIGGSVAPSNKNAAIAIGYCRFIIDSTRGNTSGNSPIGSPDAVSSVDFIYNNLTTGLMFPNDEGYNQSKATIYFPGASNLTGITLPINIYYRRELETLTPLYLPFRVYSQMFGTNSYYINKVGSGTIDKLPLPGSPPA